MHALPQAIRPVTWLLFSRTKGECPGQTGAGWDVIPYFVGRDKEHLFQEVLLGQLAAGDPRPGQQGSHRRQSLGILVKGEDLPREGNRVEVN